MFDYLYLKTILFDCRYVAMIEVYDENGDSDRLLVAPTVRWEWLAKLLLRVATFRRPEGTYATRIVPQHRAEILVMAYREFMALEIERREAEREKLDAQIVGAATQS